MNLQPLQDFINTQIESGSVLTIEDILTQGAGYKLSLQEEITNG